MFVTLEGNKVEDLLEVVAATKIGIPGGCRQEHEIGILMSV